MQLYILNVPHSLFSHIFLFPLLASMFLPNVALTFGKFHVFSVLVSDSLLFSFSLGFFLFFVFFVFFLEHHLAGYSWICLVLQCLHLTKGVTDRYV